MHKTFIGSRAIGPRVIGSRVIASIVLAAAVHDGAFARDIRGLQSVTLGAERQFITTSGGASGERFGSALEVYDGGEPFESLSANPQADMGGACGVWGCDRTGAEVTPGRVSAWMWQVNDAGGASAVARIVYRSSGTQGMLLTINHFYFGGELRAWLDDQSWEWGGCFEEFVPPGADLVIQATSEFSKDGSTNFEFSLTPLGGDPAPIVVGASAYAEERCRVSEPQGGSDWDSITIAPSDLACGESVSANTSSSSAIFRPHTVPPNEGAWTAELQLSASGVITSGCNDAQGRAEAVLVLTEPLTLYAVEEWSGVLTLDGSVVSAAFDFPITLEPGTHGLEFRSTDDSEVTATIQLETTSDADASADCNANGTADGCEILVGDLADIDRNWLPDTCQRARGDLTVDGIIDAADLTVVLAAWGTNNPDADLNDDGLVGAVDIAELLNRWGPLE